MHVFQHTSCSDTAGPSVSADSCLLQRSLISFRLATHGLAHILKYTQSHKNMSTQAWTLTHTQSCNIQINVTPTQNERIHKR